MLTLLTILNDNPQFPDFFIHMLYLIILFHYHFYKVYHKECPKAKLTKPVDNEHISLFAIKNGYLLFLKLNSSQLFCFEELHQFYS